MPLRALLHRTPPAPQGQAHANPHTQPGIQHATSGSNQWRWNWSSRLAMSCRSLPTLDCRRADGGAPSAELRGDEKSLDLRDFCLSWWEGIKGGLHAVESWFEGRSNCRRKVSNRQVHGQCMTSVRPV